MAHPNVRNRQVRASGNRTLVFATKPIIAQWIDEELAGHDLTVQIARSVGEVVAALVEDPPPRPQILIADFAQMSATDVLQLHAIRDHGWFGSIIALGPLSDDLESSLNVGRVLQPPFGRGALHEAIGAVGLHRATSKMTKIVP